MKGHAEMNMTEIPILRKSLSIQTKPIEGNL